MNKFTTITFLQLTATNDKSELSMSKTMIDSAPIRWYGSETAPVEGGYKSKLWLALSDASTIPTDKIVEELDFQSKPDVIRKDVRLPMHGLLDKITETKSYFR